VKQVLLSEVVGMSKDGTKRETCETDGCDNNRKTGWTLCLTHGRAQLEVWD
jgi:hypothetical protein